MLIRLGVNRAVFHGCGGIIKPFGLELCQVRQPAQTDQWGGLNSRLNPY